MWIREARQVGYRLHANGRRVEPDLGQASEPRSRSAKLVPLLLDLAQRLQPCQRLAVGAVTSLLDRREPRLGLRVEFPRKRLLRSLDPKLVGLATCFVC
jgi:hypothetical protein